MKARAAVAWEAKKPLSIEEVMGPKRGEVLLKVIASGVCHTDAFTLSGDDPEGVFPVILAHEGGCEVVEQGEGVTSLAVGDHVIPLYIPECGECEYCKSPKTNLCQSIASTVWTGYMPDGTRRFSKNGKDIYHYMGCSTFAPICNPMNGEWGKNCFTAYLGDDTKAWSAYDATALIEVGARVADILIDQGTADEFYDEKQLLPQNLKAACDKAGQAITLRMQEGYDHSCHFIASFIGEHIAYHARALKS